MAQEYFFWLALSLVPGVGSILMKRLLDDFKTPEVVFEAPKKDLLRVEGLGEKVALEILKGPLDKRVKRELSLLERVGAKLLAITDEDYPERLKEIYDPPPLLYLRGGLQKEDQLAVAREGSR